MFSACNCHNHAIDCYYSEQVAQEKRSLDINGNYEGGGVCRSCQHNTYGINCERCKPGYYRPTGVPKTSADVCQGISYFSLSFITLLIFFQPANVGESAPVLYIGEKLANVKLQTWSQIYNDL